VLFGQSDKFPAGGLDGWDGLLHKRQCKGPKEQGTKGQSEGVSKNKGNCKSKCKSRSFPTPEKRLRSG
jgi:hypothetical protein